MTISEHNPYTPTTAEIREYVEVGGDPRPWEEPGDELDAKRAAAFDRWLAAHDAEVTAAFAASLSPERCVRLAEFVRDGSGFQDAIHHDVLRETADTLDRIAALASTPSPAQPTEANVPLEEGPATIRMMPESPETSQRHWSMYCDECDIEEGMADSATERWLVKRVYAHNHEMHSKARLAPSPAQPTEASEREALAKALFNVRDDEFDTDEWGDLDSVGRERWETYADAALAAGFRLAPSPVQGADDTGMCLVCGMFCTNPAHSVQGADDRLAQAEAVIAEALLVGGDDAKKVLDEVWRILEAYQQSPQAALNEVRAGALEEAANAVDAEAPDEPWAGASFESHATWLRARAAELRAAPQTGDAS